MYNASATDNTELRKSKKKRDDDRRQEERRIQMLKKLQKEEAERIKTAKEMSGGQKFRPLSPFKKGYQNGLVTKALSSPLPRGRVEGREFCYQPIWEARNYRPALNSPS